MLIHLNIQNYRVTDVAMPARYGEEASDLYMSKVLNHISAIALTPLRLPHLRKVHLTKLLAGSAFLVAAAANFPTGRLFRVVSSAACAGDH